MGIYGKNLKDGVGLLSRAVIALRTTRKRMPNRQSEVHRKACLASSLENINKWIIRIKPSQERLRGMGNGEWGMGNWGVEKWESPPEKVWRPPVLLFFIRILNF